MYGSMRILSENLLSALVAIRSLRDAGSKQDIIILTIEEPTNETRRYLAAQSIQIITVPPIRTQSANEMLFVQVPYASPGYIHQTAGPTTKKPTPFSIC
eukprot:m.646451 g.646451  ORF g.646451 m.646451 type:complete len:99 (-) comp58366_c0_seq15:1448-1744(-)